MKEVVIVAAGRTAIGRFKGSLSALSASELGATVIKRLLEKTGIAAEHVDEVIMGQVTTSGHSRNPARQAAIGAGLPDTIPAMTINQLCGSGLKAVQLAAQAIELYDAELIIAGGQESASQAGHILGKIRRNQTTGIDNLMQSLMQGGLLSIPYEDRIDITAKLLAERYGISRRAQDDFSACSHNKAEAALAANRFADEIIPVTLSQSNGTTTLFDRDEQPLTGALADTLGQLNPWQLDGCDLTAGNTSPLSDGAAAVIVCSAEKAEQLGLEPLAYIASYAAPTKPSPVNPGFINATQSALSRAGWHADDPDLIEVSETFAAQVISLNKELKWDNHKVNVNGGSIALGNPMGASGCRILVSLLHEMTRRDLDRGLATLGSGNLGLALAVER